MIAQELRIGNWVNMCIYDNVTPHQINSEDIDRFDWYGIEKWQPIPLTEDILLKCGFVKELSCLVLNVNDGSGDIYSHAPFSSLYLNYGYDADGTSPLPNSQHLHQLQNLYFALTGTELDYDNK